MRSQGIRRLTKDRPDPVVSYSRLPAEDSTDASGEAERIEPRLTVIPIERTARFEEVAAPSPIDVRARATAEDIEPAPVTRDDPLEERRPRRGAASRIIVVVGIVALLAAAGVLFTTFGHIFNGNSMVAVAPPAPQTPLDVTPGAPATAETAGPGVRLIPKDSTAAEAQAPADTALKPTTEAAPEDAPLPNLRPDEPASQSETAVAEPQPLPAPAAAAPAPADDDLAGLMANVDRILAERKAAGPQQQAIAPQDTLDAPPMDSASSVPLVGLMGGALIVRAPGGTSARPGLLIEDPDNMPVPPADIPNPGQ
jgi:hypothetical protein